MTCGIYIITNEITGKSYIGQSIHIEKRIKQHKCKQDLKTSYIENSIQKHGWNNFNWNILCECSPENLDIEEMKFIALYDTYNNGYNLTRGGDLKGIGNPMHNPECVKKCRESNKGFKHSHETKRAMSHNINRTGFYHVFKEYDNKLVQGFTYRYESKTHKPVRSIDIKKLESKIKKLGWEWLIINPELAEKTLEESAINVKKSNNSHPNGYYRVSKCNDKNYIKGFYYRYTFSENGKVKYTQATRIKKLKEKVLAKGWEWRKLHD